VKNVVALPNSKTKLVPGMVNAILKRLNVLVTLNLTVLIATPKDARPTPTVRRAVVTVLAMKLVNACVKIVGPLPIVACPPAPTCAVDVVSVRRRRLVNVTVASKVKTVPNVNAPTPAMDTVLVTKPRTNAPVKKVLNHGWATIALTNATALARPMVNAWRLPLPLRRGTPLPLPQTRTEAHACATLDGLENIVPTKHAKWIAVILVLATKDCANACPGSAANLVRKPACVRLKMVIVKKAVTSVPVTKDSKDPIVTKDNAPLVPTAKNAVDKASATRRATVSANLNSRAKIVLNLLAPPTMC
jgi:hypothetical protein